MEAAGAEAIVIVTVHQPEHLPWLGFLHKASQADLFVILDNVQYRKNYFQNRNRVLGANGPMWVTVPVLTKGHTLSTIRDIRIDNTAAWRQRWWKSLYFSYKGAPHFAEHLPFFEGLAAGSWQSLAEFNEEIIKYLFDVYEIRCPLVRASALPVEGTRSSLLLDICRNTRASVYLAGSHGRDYLDEALFEAAGIGVRYHEFTHPTYPQLRGGEFVPNLSAVDLLWMSGPEARRILRTAPWQAPARGA